MFWLLRGKVPVLWKMFCLLQYLLIDFEFWINSVFLLIMWLMPGPKGSMHLWFSVLYNWHYVREREPLDASTIVVYERHSFSGAYWNTGLCICLLSRSKFLHVCLRFLSYFLKSCFHTIILLPVWFVRLNIMFYT